MKKMTLTYLTLTSLLTSPFAVATEGERFLQSEEAVQTATYGHIDARGLKALLDAKTPLTLLDARGNKWHDNSIIPGALLASYEYTPEELQNLIPHADSLIVVYCFSFTCPLSKRLAVKLVDLGYTNVVEYPAGLKEWRDVAGYPIEEIL